MTTEATGMAAIIRGVVKELNVHVLCVSSLKLFHSSQYLFLWTPYAPDRRTLRGLKMVRLCGGCVVELGGGEAGFEGGQKEKKGEKTKNKRKKEKEEKKERGMKRRRRGGAAVDVARFAQQSVAGE